MSFDLDLHEHILCILNILGNKMQFGILQKLDSQSTMFIHNESLMKYDISNIHHNK